MTDITVIILVGKEELHIARCLEKLAALEPREVIVVESQKGDRTHEIAVAHGATCVWHDWPGNQAAQFNWILKRLEIRDKRLDKEDWILRLDADEYLEDDTIEELKRLVTPGGLPPDVTSLSLSLARCFCGRRIRFGNPDVVLVRAFRFGYGRSTQSEMDERIETTSGRCYHLRGKFVDDSLMPMDEWREKHRGYAKREAKMALAGCANPNKRAYYRLPPYLRAFAYFAYRYFFRLGFLDGRAGWMWHFWQGLWYRLIVDKEIRGKRN